MWNLIPQVFYDLLARVVPGATLILLTLIILFSPVAFADFVLNFPDNDKLFMELILLGGFSSYVVGFLLDWLWETTIGRFTRSGDSQTESKCKQECLAEHNRMREALKYSELDIASESLPRAFVMRDHLRKIAPEEASRLLKVRAERRLCQVLLMGFFTLGVVNGVYLWPQLEMARIALEVLLVFAVVACWGGAQSLHRQFVNGTTVSWLVFVASSEMDSYASQLSVQMAEVGIKKKAEGRTRKGRGKG